MRTRASYFVIIALLVVIVYVNAQVTIPEWVTAQKTPWSQSNANKRLGCSSVLPGAYKQIECICSFLEDQINVRGTPEYSLAQTYRIGWDYVFPQGSPNVNPLEAYSLSLRADVYDNSMAAILLMLAGQMESARRICDTMVLLVDLDKVGDGRTRAAYYQNNPVQREYDGSVPVTYGAQVFDYDVYTGNLAFQIIALARFYHHTNDYKYLQAAIKIAKFIDGNLRYDSSWGGYAAGMQYNATADSESHMFWRSAEHNIGVFAAARLLYSLTEDNQWKDMMNHAKSFVSNMYQSDGGFYYVGTTNEQNKDEWVTVFPACDAQTWNLLSEADDDIQRKTNSLNWVLNNLQASEYQQDPLSGQSLQYNGVLFSSGGTGIQSEQTAAAAMAFYAHGKRIAASDSENSQKFINAADKYIQTLLNMQKYALRSDGHGIVASVNPSGALVWPGDEIAKETWRYYPLLHTAASAWTGLALHYIRNGDEFANPYADYSKKKVDQYFGPIVSSPTTETQDQSLGKTYSIGIATLVISVVLGLIILSALVVLTALNVRLYRKNKQIEDVDRGSRSELMAFTQLASPDTPNSPVDDSPR